MFRMACAFFLIILKAHHEDAAKSKTILEMIRSYGYPAEQFRRIKTHDGYLLTVQRIPYGVSNHERENRPVVFLMHGLLSSAFDFVNMGPGVSIVYDLAEAGYDVWMGNARGTKMSRAHEYLSPIFNNKRFWAYSFHEIGYYDLPAMIDFALKKTKQKKLSYIGHSQGNTCFFVMASTRPKYNKKIKIMVALAPVVFMGNMWNPFLQLLTSKLMGWNEFIPGEKLFNLIGKRACDATALFRSMCASVFFLIGGWDSQQFNNSAIPVIVANAPAGASVRQFIHYAQGINTGKFRQYDFGKIKNFVKYGSTVPPHYKIKNITAPVALIYANNDWLSAPQDVEKLQVRLRNVVDVYRVPYKWFNHFDYLYAINVKKLVIDHVVATLNKNTE